MISLEKDYSKLRKVEKALDRCPRCGKRSMAEDPENGELFCSNCGFVVKEKMQETGPEWTSFSDEQGRDKSRAGLPTSVAKHDMGLATIIGPANRDASGRAVHGAMKPTLERMRTWDRRSQQNASRDRNLNRAFRELYTFAEKLAVSDDIVERAAYIYRKALERELVRGRSITSIIVASLYAACRDREVPRTLKEVASVSNVGKMELARSYRLLLKELDLRVPVADPLKSVSKIASRAGLSEKTKRRAFEILTAARRMGLSAGKDPMGLAASALYVASTLEGEDKTQKDLADAAQVTEVTIRNRYRDVRLTLDI